MAAAVTAALSHATPADLDCDATYAKRICSLFVSITFILHSSKGLHFLLKYLGQPRIISEILAGMLISNTGLIFTIDRKVPRLVRIVSDYGFMGYFFVLGLEMEPRNLLQRRPSREAILAYAGIIGTTLVIVGFYASITSLYNLTVARFVLALALGLANTSSAVLTRLITELKIGKSEVGRVVLNAGVHNDMTTLICMSLHLVLQVEDGGPELRVATARSLFTLLLLALEIGFFVRYGRRGLNWINRRNPEGKPLNWWHVAAVTVGLTLMCTLASTVGYSSNLNAFLIGLTLPREGRVSRLFINGINAWLGEFIFPFYYAMMGTALTFDQWKGTGWWTTTSEFMYFFLITTTGKVVGTAAAALSLGFGVPEAICMGLLLNVRGHYHILIGINSLEVGNVTGPGFLLGVVCVIVTIVIIPVVAVVIIWRSRKTHEELQMALQWQDPDSELRMMVCLHGPSDVPAAIRLIEAARGGPLSPGIKVYSMDLVELTARTEASLTYGQGDDAVEVTDEAVVEMRAQISAAFDAYLYGVGEGVSMRRLLAVSAYSNMHLDVCNAAHDALALLVVLPFHKKQRLDGNMDDGDANVRAFNRRVLRKAPCSVGILVDRGLAGSGPDASALDDFSVAVVFIGGADDREALCLAARVAHYPGVKVTAIRFLPDADVCASDDGSRRRSVPNSMSAQSLIDYTEEMRLDDDCFTEFYERHVANGTVMYAEKYVTDSAEALAALRAVEGQYNLFIVGLARPMGSIQAVEMSALEECPELGPLGDAMSTSDFSLTASILIIQQHDPSRQAQAADEPPVDDDFSILRRG